jgi:hypothetical protein
MMKTMTRAAVAVAVVMTVAGAATPAMAGSDDVIRRGSCTGASDWKLKLSPEDGRLEVEFEVDSNVVGQTWNVRLFQNGTRIFAGSRQTTGPSGSFELRRLANNTAGRDSFRARAANASTGEVCVGTASIG